MATKTTLQPDHSSLHEAPETADTGSRPSKVAWYQREFYIGRAVKAEIVMNFTRQLSSFVRSGISLLDALAIVGDEANDKKMAETIGAIERALRAGESMGDAIGEHPKVFPGYYISMVRAAEMTGRLDDVLLQLADYMERDLSARRQVKSALTYPAFVMGLAVVAVVVIATFVLPKFKGLYTSLGAKLPLPTRMLLGITDFFAHYTLLVILGLISLGGLGYGLIGGKQGKRRRDRLTLRLPVLGGLFHLIAVERFCRVLSALVTAGVPLPDSMLVAADSTNNFVFQVKLAEVRDAMMRGLGLAAPIAEVGIFPAAARQMIRVGESTGTLDHQLHAAADFYARELDFRLKKSTDLFEPIVIVFVGCVVGFVALAQISAMYSVFHQIKSP